MQEAQAPSLGQEDALEEEMAAHSSVLAWKRPWTGEPSGLQSMGSQRIGHDLAHMCALQPTRLLHPWDSPGKVLEWGAIAFSVLHAKEHQR